MLSDSGVGIGVRKSLGIASRLIQFGLRFKINAIKLKLEKIFSGYIAMLSRL